ncbi:MAG TPA: LPS assembly protein LptD [Terriglobales bacterium]|nr:LPS assembly protein LptD [Terriglobales bacterium]
MNVRPLRPRRRFPAFPAALTLVLLAMSVASPSGRELSPSFAAQERAAAPGQAAASPPPEVRIVARTKEFDKDRIYASGDVEIHYGEFRLFADRVSYDPATKELMAEGNVVIQARDEVTRAERAFLNLGTGRGRVEKASGLIQPTILFSAGSVEREGDDLYELSRARVTTCTQPVPRWSFSFSRAELEKDDHIEMRNAVLSVKNVPVFYLPYLRYPLRDRATGFLMPKLGYSEAKGFSYSQSFYWALARNMDATVGLDAYPKVGLGAGLEYRYLFEGGTGGQVNLYYFTFNRDASGARPSPATVVRLNHSQALPFGFTLAAHVDAESSFDFLRNFDPSFRGASISNRSAQAYLSRSWSRFNISVRVSRFETYFEQVGDSIVSTSLPEVNLNVFRVRLFAPVYFSLTGGFKNWQYGWRSQYDTGAERHANDLFLSPTLSLPFSSIPWLTADTSVAANFHYYGQTLAPGTTQIVGEPLFTRNLAVNVAVTGPVFSRIFFGRGGEPRLKNIVEPFLTYTYDSPVNDASRLVTSYGFFRFHQLAYGVNSRFFVKKAGLPVEVLSVGLAQTYYFSPATGPLGQYLVDGKPPRFSEITGTLRYYPKETFSLDAAAGYNPYYHNFSSLRLTATAGSRPDGRFLSLNWYKSMNSWATGVDPSLASLYNRHQLGLSGGLRLPGAGLELVGDIDYNLQEHKLLYTAGQVVYHYQCLDFQAEVRVYYFRVPPQTEFRLSVAIGNIGRTPEVLGGLRGFGL